jgi:hypothetical protein
MPEYWLKGPSRVGLELGEIQARLCLDRTARNSRPHDFESAIHGGAFDGRERAPLLGLGGCCLRPSSRGGMVMPTWLLAVGRQSTLVRPMAMTVMPSLGDRAPFSTARLRTPSRSRRSRPSL